MLTYADILDICMQRATRLGLVAGDTAQPDAAELETYIFHALLELSEMTDIPAYLVHDSDMGRTVEGDPTLALPGEFGRLILPRVRNKRGIFLVVGDVVNDLTYFDPIVMTKRQAVPRGIPEAFSVLAHDLWFWPTPSGSYHIKGTYIRTIERPDLDDPVELAYPTALVELALFRLASDMGKSLQSLVATRQESLTRLSVGSR